MKIVALPLAMLAACTPHVREARAPEPPTSQERALAALQAGAAQPSRDIAPLCQAAGALLTADLRARCAQAHLDLARDALHQKKFDTARGALAFAETEGADLSTVRRLRESIPGYEKLQAHDAPPRLPAKIARHLAAGKLTERFALSRLSGWNINASAEGRDCDVLLVTFFVVMEDSMIAALHNGDLIYGQIVPGGLSAFGSSNGFRAVVYRDGDGRTWSFGELRADEASKLAPCDPAIPAAAASPPSR